MKTNLASRTESKTIETNDKIVSDEFLNMRSVLLPVQNFARGGYVRLDQLNLVGDGG